MLSFKLYLYLFSFYYLFRDIIVGLISMDSFLGYLFELSKFYLGPFLLQDLF